LRIRPPPPQPEKPLAERIEGFRAELDQFIDAKASEIKEASPGVPEGVIRNMITNRFFGCQCQSVLHVLEQSE
jgi:hypothetical protein